MFKQMSLLAPFPVSGLSSISCAYITHPCLWYWIAPNCLQVKSKFLNFTFQNSSMWSRPTCPQFYSNSSPGWKCLPTQRPRPWAATTCPCTPFPTLQVWHSWLPTAHLVKPHVPEAFLAPRSLEPISPSEFPNRSYLGLSPHHLTLPSSTHRMKFLEVKDYYHAAVFLAGGHGINLGSRGR